MSMKIGKTKGKKAGSPPPGRTAREAWDRSNDKLRDTMHSLGFLGPSVLGVAVFFIEIGRAHV